jgi:hypothetical protein
MERLARRDFLSELTAQASILRVRDLLATAAD